MKGPKRRVVQGGNGPVCPLCWESVRGGRGRVYRIDVCSVLVTLTRVFSGGLGTILQQVREYMGCGEIANNEVVPIRQSTL